LRVRIDLRTKDGWTADRLTRLDERLAVPSCGLQCVVGEIYDRTPLNRGRGRA
jgi:hypothetical protein